MKLLFLGNAAFAVPILEALLKAQYTITYVYTSPPRPAGRGHKVQLSPVHECAQKYDLPVRTPVTLKTPSLHEDFLVDTAIVVAYGLILPKVLLTLPRLGCINVHASLLPRWRGAAPIQRALLAGDKETGVSIMKMDAGVDTGPLLQSKSIPILAQTSSQDLQKNLSRIGANLLVSVLEQYNQGLCTPIPQPKEGVYAAKITHKEGRIHWANSALYIDRQVRALNPWPGTWLHVANERLKVHTCSLISENSSQEPPGTLLDKYFTVACGKGNLRLLRVQRPGRTIMDGTECLRGLSLHPYSLLQDGQ